MSQRECAGFNWPPPSVPASDPVSSSPESVNRAGWLPINVNACSLNGLPRPCSNRTAKNSGVADALRQSRAAGFAQPEHAATVFRLLSLLPAALFPFCAGVPAIGVGHPARLAMSQSRGPLFLPSARIALTSVPIRLSLTKGVGHPVESISDVRRADARRRKRDGPEGVTHGFHVSVYKVDPRLDSLACNLLSKDDCRLALLDEPGKSWPKVP